MSVDYRFSTLPIRGVHVDCRAQMLRFEQIVRIFRDLARWGYNTVLLEYEDRFPYAGELKSIAAPDALSRSQVRRLDRLAASLGLRIMPLVQCLGHLEYVLRLDRFRPLAEGMAEEKRWPSTVCASNPKARHLFRRMIEQVLELHPDCRHLHLGGDEAASPSECPRCRPRLERDGYSRLLVDHFIDRADWVRARGPDPVLWCDMPLRHPEALDALRGHVTVMDWDYWSTSEPTERPTRVWGLPRGQAANPRDWPEAHRRLFERYVFTEDGRGRPFPYTPFLRDRGFPVLVAPALRSSGDNCCAPRPLHVDNVIGAARTAAENHVLGCVITSWAVRREPWPLTEYGLIAGGLAMRNPLVDRREIDAAFAAEHFGRPDPELARVADLLGAPVEGLTDSRARFDGESNSWAGATYAQRVELVRKNPAACREALDTLRRNVARARKLLDRAAPRTASQRSRVALWRWAADVLDHYAAFGPRLLQDAGGQDPAELRTFRAETDRLAARTRRLLSPLYTPRTIGHEHQTRFGGLRDYLDRMLAASRD